jgi:guanine deaminase
MNIDSRFREEFMQRAVQLALKGSEAGQGGPFGAVIVREGKIISEGFNQVTSSNDPSAHAEIVAIRKACNTIGDFQLTGCEIYCSCEPCPMCLGAIYWARPDMVFFGSSRNDAALAGFDDEFIYQEINRVPEIRKIPMFFKANKSARDVFQQWLHNPNRIDY